MTEALMSLVFPLTMATLFLIWEAFYDNILMDKGVDPKVMHIYQQPARGIMLVGVSDSIQMLLVLVFWYWLIFDMVFNKFVLGTGLLYIGGTALIDKWSRIFSPWVMFLIKIVSLGLALFIYLK